MSGDIALGIARPWPPFLIGIAMLVGCWSSRPSALACGVVGLMAGVTTLLATSWVCLHPRPDHVTVPDRCVHMAALFGQWSSGNVGHLILSPVEATREQPSCKVS